MCAKTDIDIVDKQHHQTQFRLYVCQNGCRHYRHTTSPNSNFDYMCVKTNVDIVDKTCKLMYVNMQVRRYAGMQECKYARMQVDKKYGNSSSLLYVQSGKLAGA